MIKLTFFSAINHGVTYSLLSKIYDLKGSIKKEQLGKSDRLFSMKREGLLRLRRKKVLLISHGHTQGILISINCFESRISIVYQQELFVIAKLHCPEISL